MPAHYDLLIRGGTCVLPWGEYAIDVGVRGGQIATLGAAGATAEQVLVETYLMGCVTLFV